MDKLTKGIQDELPWCTLFADDIILIDETKDEVNDKLKRWKHTLESKSFRVSRSKIKYLHCGFSGGEEGGEVIVQGMAIPKVDKFKYLSSIIHHNEAIDKNINQCIIVG